MKTRNITSWISSFLLLWAFDVGSGEAGSKSYFVTRKLIDGEMKVVEPDDR